MADKRELKDGLMKLEDVSKDIRENTEKFMEIFDNELDGFTQNCFTKDIGIRDVLEEITKQLNSFNTDSDEYSSDITRIKLFGLVQVLLVKILQEKQTDAIQQNLWNLYEEFPRDSYGSVYSKYPQISFHNLCNSYSRVSEFGYKFSGIRIESSSDEISLSEYLEHGKLNSGMKVINRILKDVYGEYGDDYHKYYWLSKIASVRRNSPPVEPTPENIGKMKKDGHNHEYLRGFCSYFEQKLKKIGKLDENFTIERIPRPSLDNFLYSFPLVEELEYFLFRESGNNDGKKSFRRAMIDAFYDFLRDHCDMSEEDLLLSIFWDYFKSMRSIIERFVVPSFKNVLGADRAFNVIQYFDERTSSTDYVGKLALMITDRERMIKCVTNGRYSKLQKDSRGKLLYFSFYGCHDKLVLVPGSITVVYGSINSKKTTLLNELQGKKVARVVVDDEFSCEYFKDDQRIQQRYLDGSMIGSDVLIADLYRKYTEICEKLEMNSDFSDTLNIGNIDDRLAIAKPSSRLNDRHPHSLFFKKQESEQLDIMNRLNRVSMKIFRENILFDTRDQKYFQFYTISSKKLSNLVEMKDGVNINTESYESMDDIDRLMRMFKERAIPLGEAGSGQKSFMMCLLQLLLPTSEPNVICIDEPESFLHSSLHEQLAEELICNRQKDSYVIFSTHSQSFLRRIIRLTIEKKEEYCEGLSLVRLERVQENVENDGSEAQEGKKHLKQTDCKVLDDQAVIREMANDPLLLKSTVESCFSELVLCENENDCSIFIRGCRKYVENIDPYWYSWCGMGGKMNILGHIRALSALSAKYCVIVDFDYILPNINFDASIASLNVEKWSTEMRCVTKDEKEVIRKLKSELDRFRKSIEQEFPTSNPKDVEKVGRGKEVREIDDSGKKKSKSNAIGTKKTVSAKKSGRTDHSEIESTRNLPSDSSMMSTQTHSKKNRENEPKIEKRSSFSKNDGQMISNQKSKSKDPKWKQIRNWFKENGIKPREEDDSSLKGSKNEICNSREMYISIMERNRDAILKIVTLFQELNVFILPVGEIEGFSTLNNRDKLNKNFKKDPELEMFRNEEFDEFIRKFLKETL